MKNIEILKEKMLLLMEEAGEDLPIAAMVVDEDGKIISSALNKCEKEDNPLLHAELLSIDQALKIKKHSLSTCTLLVSLEPCLMCYGAAVNAGIKQIIYFARSREGAFSYFHVDTQSSNIIASFVEDNRFSIILSEYFKKVVRN